MGILSDIWDGFVSVGKALVGVVVDAAQFVIRETKKFVDEASTELSKLFRDAPKTEKERVERDLQEVNARVQSLRKRHKERGHLTDYETRQWQGLRAEREELNALLRSLDQFEAAEEVVAKEGDYKPIHITEATAHILQFHVGQSTVNKTCVCGRSMVLQWDRRIATPGPKDFCWGCSGWYLEVGGRRACERMVGLTMSDLDLFANLQRPEFEISSAALTKTALDPTRAKRLRDALQGIRDIHRKRRLGIAVYRCPFHGESLVMKQKRVPDGLLDEFFLGCPRWLPDDAGCNFLVKLKSPAQISGVLEAESGIGLLQTVGG